MWLEKALSVIEIGVCAGGTRVAFSPQSHFR